jgi:acylphosphatase
MKERYKINVRGRVQGVFFRKYTQATAIRLGIKGWVRNEPDGSVSIDAEGEAAAIKEFLLWCQHGPEYAIVQNIDMVQVYDIHQYDDFDIQR